MHVRPGDKARGGPADAGARPGRADALAAAYVLVDDIQQVQDYGRIERELAAVAGLGWPDVETILHFAGVLIGRARADVPLTLRHSDGMRRAAEESQHLALISLSVAADA